MATTDNKLNKYCNFEVFVRVRPLQNYELPQPQRSSFKNLQLSGVQSPIQQHLLKVYQKNKQNREVVRIENNIIFVKDNEYGTIDKRGKAFIFDGVFGPQFTNNQIFDRTFKHSIDHVLNGYNASIFAYGITGTGKSFTIFGDSYKYPRESRQQLCLQKGVSCLIITELFRQV